MRRFSFVAISGVLFAASIPLHGEEPVVSIGKQRAARSAVEWDVRDIDHAQLGPIKFAVQKRAVTTAVRNEKILSLVFFSCQKSTGRVAIELTNAPESDPAGGLRPTTMPRLVCTSLDPKGTGGLEKGDLSAKWEIGPLGDTLARGLPPYSLRRCVSIEVLQSVAFPPGPSPASQRIAIEIMPYSRALDSVFTACGEKTAFAPVEQATPAVPPVVRLGPAPESGPGAASAGAPWQPARTTANGRTIVRADAGLDSPIVVKLDPNTRLQVRRTSTPWWEVKPRSGAGFRGYIREDRLVLE